MTNFQITKQNGVCITADPVGKYLKMTRELPDGEYIVSAKKKTHRRNNDQNALFHAWIKVFADHIGEVSYEACKTDVKRHILGVKERESKITGKATIEDYKTSEMTTAELASFMEKFKVWAKDEFGCILPYWKDAEYEQMIEQYG